MKVNDYRIYNPTFLTTQASTLGARLSMDQSQVFFPVAKARLL